jgi:single-strand DNA-binding protein
MNIIEIAGHLGADPVTRFTATGQKVTTFNVATNSRKGGNEVTIWFRVTIWGERFDKMLTYLKKGSAVIIIGELQKPEIWTDKEGRPQISLDVTAEIVKFSPFGKPDRTDQPQAHANAGSNAPSGYGLSGRSRDDEFGEQSFQGGHGRGSQQGSKQNSQDKIEELEEDEVPF